MHKTMKTALGAGNQSTLLLSLETRVGANIPIPPTRNSLAVLKMPRIDYCGLASVYSDGGCVALFHPIF